jgi:rubrerythrin
MPKSSETNLARIIYEAYPDSDLLPIDPEQHCRSLDDLLERVTTQDIGDTLFKFLVTEIVEGGEGTLEGAIRILKRARKDVDAVLQALFRARADHPKESPRAAHRIRGPRPTDLGIWRCRDCRRVLYRSHKKVAKAGSPYCPACGREMRLD